MKFAVTHTLEHVGLEAFEACYFDEKFNEALCRHARLTRTLRTLIRDDGRLVRAVHVVPDRQLPGPVAKVLGVGQLGYTEHVRYTFGSYAVDWRVEPDVLADKVASNGTVTFREDGRGGVVRTVQGEVVVRIFGLGGTVERFIVADLEKSYADAARFMAEYMAANG